MMEENSVIDVKTVFIFLMVKKMGKNKKEKEKKTFFRIEVEFYNRLAWIFISFFAGLIIGVALF